MTLALNARTAVQLRLLGRLCCALALALLVGAALLPAPTPPPASDRPDPLVTQALASVEATLKSAEEAAAKAAVPVENWASLGAALEKIRKPPRPVVAAAPAQEEPAQPKQAEQTPKGPQPATTNPILSTWRYLGPIVVGASKYAVLSIRDKQVLMAQGESSQRFRIVDILPEKLVVEHEDGGAAFEIALAKPRAAGASPVAPGARPGPARNSRGALPVFQRDSTATGAQPPQPPAQRASRGGRQP